MYVKEWKEMRNEHLYLIMVQWTFEQLLLVFKFVFKLKVCQIQEANNASNLKVLFYANFFHLRIANATLSWKWLLNKIFSKNGFQIWSTDITSKLKFTWSYNLFSVRLTICGYIKIGYYDCLFEILDICMNYNRLLEFDSIIFNNKYFSNWVIINLDV